MMTPLLCELSNTQPSAHAQDKGQVCGGGCLTNAVPGHAFTAVGMEGGRAGQKGLKYSTEAMVK